MYSWSEHLIHPATPVAFFEPPGESSFELVSCVSECFVGAVVLAVSSLTARGGKHGWLPDDLNNGRLDLFFLFLAGQHFDHLHICVVCDTHASHCPDKVCKQLGHTDCPA